MVVGHRQQADPSVGRVSTPRKGRAVSDDDEEALLTPAKFHSDSDLKARLQTDKWQHPGWVGLCCVGWMVLSTMLIIVNKRIMVDKGFHYPMAVAGMGMAVSSVAGFLCCRVFKVVKAQQPMNVHLYATKILPVGFFMALTLLTGNQVYLYLTVAFIQMLKAFTPVITMLALFVARLEDPSNRLIYSVVTISLGTMVAAMGEVNLSVIGMVCMFASEAAEAVRMVLTQYLLQGLKFHPIEGLMYMAPACFAWLFLGMCLWELPLIAQDGAARLILENKLEFAAGAGMGFAVNSLAFIVIKLAGSLTLKVLGTVKNTTLVVISIALLNETVTITQSWGYAVSLAGFVWYNHIKMASPTPAPAGAAGVGGGAAASSGGAAGAGSS